MSKKNFKKAGAKLEEKKEFDEEVLQIDRVTRVVKGGRRLRFRVTVAIGDRKGRVGVGVGKATEVVNGIKKAVAVAKNALIRVPITEGDTIPHEINIKHKAARMVIMPASAGTGVIAGGALRKILGLAGIKNVLSKNFGSRNTLVTAQASIEALKSLEPAKKPAKFEKEAGKAEDRKTEAETNKEKRQKELAKKAQKAAEQAKPKEPVAEGETKTPDAPAAEDGEVSADVTPEVEAPEAVNADATLADATPEEGQTPEAESEEVAEAAPKPESEEAQPEAATEAPADGEEAEAEKES